MKCHIQLEDRVPHNDATYLGSGNVLLDHLLGDRLPPTIVGIAAITKSAVTIPIIELIFFCFFHAIYFVIYHAINISTSCC